MKQQTNRTGDRLDQKTHPLELAADSAAKDKHLSITTKAVKNFVGGNRTTVVSLGGDGYLGERRGTVKRPQATSSHGAHARAEACAMGLPDTALQLSTRMLFSVITRAHFAISA